MEHIAVLTSKGQVTIPKPVREALQLTEKDRVLFVVEGERAVLIPLRQRPITDLFGALPATRPYPGTDTIREAVRKARVERLTGEA